MQYGVYKLKFKTVFLSFRFQLISFDYRFVKVMFAFRCPLIIVSICNAIAEGLMQPWMPGTASAHKMSATELPPSPTDKSQKRVKPSNASIKQVKSKTAGFSFSPDALPHLKAALEVFIV